jgi:2-methylcitrate dehydratase PrpD
MFSVPYLAAAAFVRGAVGLDDLLAERVLDPTVADLARRIEVVVDPAVPAEALVPISLSVELDDGETISITVDVLPGSPRDDIDEHTIVQKMRGCFAHAKRGPWGDVDVDRLVEVVQGIDRSDAPSEAIHSALV